jgi:hypothetical protein
MLARCTIHTHLPRCAALMFSREDPSHGRAPSPYHSRLGGLTCGARKRAPSSPVAPVATRASQPAQAPLPGVSGPAPAMGPPAGPVRVSLSLGGGHDENERRSEASDGGPGAEVHSSAARGGLDRPGRFRPGARQCGRRDHPLRAGLGRHRSSLTCSRHVRSGAPCAVVVGGCVRPLSPRPRDLRRTARAACLKRACLTAMAARLPAFSGYRR